LGGNIVVRSPLIILVLLALAFAVVAAEPSANTGAQPIPPPVKVYVADPLDARIRRANEDGSAVEEVVKGFGELRGIAVDESGGAVYWTDYWASRIQGAALDGTGVHDVVSGVSFPRDIAVDGAAGKVYWVSGGIRRANLDGTNVEQILSSGSSIALDLEEEKLYRTDLTTIRRSNLDGSIGETVLAGLQNAKGIAVDSVSDKIYWLDESGTLGSQVLRRADLAGTNAESLVETALCSSNDDLVLDVSGGKAYWHACDGIRRANLDGTGAELVQSVPGLEDIAVGPSGDKLYWVRNGPSSVQRSNLDGSSVEDFVTGPDRPAWLAIDHSAGKLYWTDAGLNTIQRASLTGGAVEDVLSGLNNPQGIALDVSAGKVYWTEAAVLAPGSGGTSDGSISRANVDGSGEETLITGLGDPIGVALDVAGGKIYWADSATIKLQRANLDGSVVENLLTNQGRPQGIALDLDAGKMYWTVGPNGVIQSANLDGSGVETLLTREFNFEDIGYDPRGIALDTAQGKMYWTEQTAGVRRANLDGTGSEPIGMPGPHKTGIALQTPSVGGIAEPPEIAAHAQLGRDRHGGTKRIVVSAALAASAVALALGLTLLRRARRGRGST
jgi:DNA-binding beta-propeller fold protein YncE